MVEDIVLSNAVTNTQIVLSKLKTQDYILDKVDWGVIKGTHHSYKYVNQIGESVTGTSLGTRDIEIVGWIIADSEALMTKRKSVLNRFVNPQQTIDLLYKSYVLKFKPDGSIQYGITYADNNEVICKFKITGLCPDPLFAEEVDTKIAAANTSAKFHFPLVISKVPDPPGGVVFGVRQPSLIVTVTNAGSVAVGMKIVFKANGSLSNPRLINVVTQEFFRVNKAMVAGETITINTSIGSKKVIGAFKGVESNYFKYCDLDNTWLQLEMGDNLFRYDADGNYGNLEVYIYFSNKYLEVQQCY